MPFACAQVEMDRVSGTPSTGMPGGHDSLASLSCRAWQSTDSDPSTGLKQPAKRPRWLPEARKTLSRGVQTLEEAPETAEKSQGRHKMLPGSFWPSVRPRPRPVPFPPPLSCSSSSCSCALSFLPFIPPPLHSPSRPLRIVRKPVESEVRKRSKASEDLRKRRKTSEDLRGRPKASPAFGKAPETSENRRRRSKI